MEQKMHIDRKNLRGIINEKNINFNVHNNTICCELC